MKTFDSTRPDGDDAAEKRASRRRSLALKLRRRIKPNRVLWLVEVHDDATETLRCGECDHQFKNDPHRKQRKRGGFDPAAALRVSRKIRGVQTTGKAERFLRGECPRCTREARDRRYPLPPKEA